MRKLTKALLAASLMSATFAAQAQEGPITGNVTLTTDYIYRASRRPAVALPFKADSTGRASQAFIWALGPQASLLTTASKSIISVALLVI